MISFRALQGKKTFNISPCKKKKHKRKRSKIALHLDSGKQRDGNSSQSNDMSVASSGKNQKREGEEQKHKDCVHGLDQTRVDSLLKDRGDHATDHVRWTVIIDHFR